MISSPNEWNVDARSPDESIPAAANRAGYTFLQLIGGVLVESEQKDSVRIDEPPADGVGGPGDHDRGLPGTGGGQDLKPTVEAHHRSCLFIGERTLLNRVKECSLRRELSDSNPLIRFGDVGFKVGIKEADGHELTLAESALAASGYDSIEQSGFGATRDERVDSLSRDPPLLFARRSEEIGHSSTPGSRVSDLRSKSEVLDRLLKGVRSDFEMPRRCTGDSPALHKFHLNHRRRILNGEASMSRMWMEPDASVMEISVSAMEIFQPLPDHSLALNVDPLRAPSVSCSPFNTSGLRVLRA